MANEVFLDTSVIIRRDLGAAAIKKRINDRIQQYDSTVTGLVVRQEYKRRVLKEAQYLLNQLHDKKSLSAVKDHVLNVLPPAQERKRKINLNLIEKFFPKGDGAEHTERAKRTLRAFLLSGIGQFDAGVDRIVSGTGCACAKHPIAEKIPYRSYEFGPTECSKTGGSCGITSFFHAPKGDAASIVERLRELPEERKSTELLRIQAFLEKVLANPDAAPALDPCLTVGDLLIALESVGVGAFYTINTKESQHLCRALGQNLIVRSNDPGKDDRIHLNSEAAWPEY